MLDYKTLIRRFFYKRRYQLRFWH